MSRSFYVALCIGGLLMMAASIYSIGPQSWPLFHKGFDFYQYKLEVFILFLGLVLSVLGLDKSLK